MLQHPRPEYPRPQFTRPDWLCLNGPWQFEFDHGDSGMARGLLNKELDSTIHVPFCPESRLSGLGHVDFLRAVWYRREVEVPAEWASADAAERKVLLHFQAVDYDTTVWVNGTEVGRHRGGCAPFTCDLDGVAAPGDTMTIVVRARDDNRSPRPMGKQCSAYKNEGCHYTRTTGIWQTVWLEPVPRSFLKRARITPDVAGCCFRVSQPVSGAHADLSVRVTLLDSQGTITAASAPCTDMAPTVDLLIPEPRRHLWSPADPFLYDLNIELLDASGAVIDRVASYAGLRSVSIDGQAILLNGQPVFQRLVLDQGDRKSVV